MGGSGLSNENIQFSSNLLTLTFKYIRLVCRSAKNSPLSLAALSLIFYSFIIIFTSVASFKAKKDMN